MYELMEGWLHASCCCGDHAYPMAPCIQLPANAMHAMRFPVSRRLLTSSVKVSTCCATVQSAFIVQTN